MSANSIKPSGAAIRFRAAIAAGAAALALLLVSATSAMAAYDHSDYVGKFPVANECMNVTDIAVLEPTVSQPQGYIYASCRKGTYPNESDEVMRFKLNGDPAPFQESAPYISGNRLISDPGSENGKFASPVEIAVDNSPSPNHGRLYVDSAPHVDMFNFSGAFAGSIFQPIETTIPNELEGVDVGPDGFVYVTSGLPGGRISMYNTAYQEIRRLYTASETFFGSVDHIRIDSTGAIWTRKSSNGAGIRKYESDQFTEELKPKFGVPVPERSFATTSPFVANPLVSSEMGRFDVDLTDNDLYLSRRNRIETYSQGTPTESSYQDAPTFGQGKLSESEAIAVTKDHHVYASTAGAEIAIFGPGNIVPDIKTEETDIDQVGHTGATLHGTVEPAGGAPITQCKLEYVQTTNPKPSSYPNSVPCSPDPASAPPGSNFATNTDVSGNLSGLTSGATYHYRFSAENEHGKNVGIDRKVVPAFVLKVRTLAADPVDDEGATLNASFDPDGKPTKYLFQYGLSEEYGLTSDEGETGATSGLTTVGIPVADLPSGKTFHYRVVTSNADGTTIGADRTFRTASTPEISSVHSTEVSASSAVLHAEVNPVGYDTEYYFEYGPTNAYGKQVPLKLNGEPGAPIGEGTEAISVKQTITGLQEGTTYHYRVVATNDWGPSFSADTTFDFSPPSCPNGHVRQESGASYLPDCRAYELVSPESSGATLLFPGENVFTACEFCIDPYNIRAQYPSNEGYAISPSRFTYYGGLSALPGTDAPVSEMDMYMATRTNTGWVTSVPGLQGQKAFETSRKECSASLDECIDHSVSELAEFESEFAPYRFTSEGKARGRLPTNFALIPGADEFTGMQAMSRDFSHFVFSSNEARTFGFPPKTKPAVVFAPGGQETGIGSAYDNNLDTHTVRVISKLPGGAPIPLLAKSWSNEEKAIDFRGVSTDGSHILMETPADPTLGELAYLYLRVNDSVTYDISQGYKVIPIGMTQDGTKVLFTTEAQLVEADTDSGVDLYQWREDGTPEGEYAILSQGNNQGDSDECTPNWGVSGCGVDFLKTEQAHPSGNAAVSAPGMDDQFAEDSGDAFFYSPEVLDGTHPGVRNEKNLYVYRKGAVHYVATLDRGTDITRMQISPDGRFAAIRTDSRLTAYDNDGYQQIYTLNVDSGLIRCASCNPTGAPPKTDARASMNGRFMTDDGRTFFSTADRLDPRDQDGAIMDTYEYVDGRPQLISSGQGNRDFTGGSELFNLFGSGAYVGLEGVSRNGVDVFFSTFETLVGRDRNGEYLKFYDARTGGGFSEEPPLLPCEAADECHGADSSAPPAPAINSAGNLGGSGNIAAPRKQGKKRKAHRKRRAHRHRKGTKHRRGQRRNVRRSHG